MIQIETYRGWEISFDTDNETFCAYSNLHDSEVKKQSFSATKKYIDDFIKSNQTFRPFIAFVPPDKYEGMKKIKVIGVRKDGGIVVEEKNGEKRKLSTYDEGKYILWDDSYIPKMEEYKRLDEIAKQANLQATQYAKENFSGTKLVDFVKSLTQ